MRFLLFAILGFLNVARAESVHFFDDEFLRKKVPSGQVIVQSLGYRVIYAHREGPGEVEIHLKETDLMFCLEGEAEFVTGGKAIGVKEKEPNELRGTSIVGGTIRQIKKGDFLEIAPEEPHWFKKINTPSFRYAVVKIPKT